MTIPFILLSLSLFFFIPLEGVNLTFEGDDKPVTASAYYVTRINQLAHDIITVARCFACTSLHHELRDYSLGQIAFAVFQALFAITQLLFQVNGLLTSACKQA